MAHTIPSQTVERDDAAAPPVDVAALARLADRYTIRGAEEVTRYLQRYPHLMPALHEIADRVPHYFGTELPLALEMYFIPDYDDHEGHLYVNILVPTYDDDAFDRLDRLGDDWWYLAAPPEPGTLMIDIERA